jgi:hypothetical protein
MTRHGSKVGVRLEQTGYHRLADNEANPKDVKAVNLKQGAFIVMGRHELLNVAPSQQ